MTPRQWAIRTTSGHIDDDDPFTDETDARAALCPEIGEQLMTREVTDWTEAAANACSVPSSGRP